MSVKTELYFEVMGGLGDVILRLYFSAGAWYNRMKDVDHTTAVLMSHNGRVKELFDWHPAKHKINVRDLGYNTHFHPWESPKWRKDHGLPDEGPCPPHAPEPMEFYPSPEDKKILADLSKKKVIIASAVAGTGERTIPFKLQNQINLRLHQRGYTVALVGRSEYQRAGHVHPDFHDGMVNLVDKLSVPGTIELIRQSCGIVTAHTSTLHMAWIVDRPVFLLYPEWVRKVWDEHGPGGYFFGANRPTTSHMEFRDYTLDRLEAWKVE